ncbi:FAD-dependent monooxygenase [Acidipila sp. EB88]|uniref:FAD-dependent monooxygenase n=1 Tax=Acidipila sp. EB88 TaxID=2305226 RepID=UPI000F5F0A05|nr:FAD-dependent monooxygenase [Acidipila sp. EB88]RRA47681.1 FAD-dependent oxidoreductase [Acidipila sp. EB88]
MQKMTTRDTSRSVLISGASIAGPVLAYWLNRYGFDVTLVERAPAVRSGGYPIDIRGTAFDVVERMGLLKAVQAAHIDSRTLTFVNAEGKSLATISPHDLAANEERDVELPRGTLTTLFYDLTQGGTVRYSFNDSIETLEEGSTGVEVGFKSGKRGRYDVVLGADGLHSNTRQLVFGPEEPFRRDLGFTFSGFSMPNNLGLSHGAIIYSEAGRTALALAVGESLELSVMLAYATEKTESGMRLSPQEQIERTADVFRSGGWEVPRMVEALRRADDLYFDTVSQIRMPRWSKGRVALVGDSAYAPSFFTGQGTSIAIVGAYVLAGELASHENPADAFAAYERITRPFVEANQDLPFRKGGTSLILRTQEELDGRSRMFASLMKGDVPKKDNDYVRQVHNSLLLPHYER